MREDASIPQARLAAAAGISRSHLCAIELGEAEASTEVLAAIADALGADLSIRMHPGSGPRIRDRHQAPIVEAIVRDLHPRWRRFLEVPVHRPARGFIDAVFHDESAPVIVATEVHSEIRRFEQLLRWSAQKRDSLPSADLWRFVDVDEPPTVSSLLVLRSTRANREVVEQFSSSLRAVLPARAADIVTSLREERPWPGPGIVWASVEAGSARMLDRPPRGVTFGR